MQAIRIAVGAVVAIGALSAASGVAAAPPRPDDQQGFFRQHPQARLLSWGPSRRVVGPALATGPDALSAAAAFVQDAAPILGVAPERLAPGADHLPHGSSVPLLRDPLTGEPRFIAVYHRQHLDGVPVFRARLTVLVRNVAGHPVVLASPDLRELGMFEVDPARLGAAPPPASHDTLTRRFGAIGATAPRRQVIWAGLDDEHATPRLADESIIATDDGPWLVLTDSATGELLHAESRRAHSDISGVVQGLATDGVGAEQCEPEVVSPLPHARVDIPGAGGFADQDGVYALAYAGPEPVEVTASLQGAWFQVTDFSGPEEVVVAAGTSGAPVDLLFNADNTELHRAQVNAYRSANRARAFVLEHLPGFPMLDPAVFPINVNEVDFPCPSNAYYDLDVPALNFCIAENGAPNTAFSSVVIHEYGHHVVKMGGSGQGPYGEGMSDTLSTLVLQDPRIGLGFDGDCAASARHAVNDCQYDPSGCSSCGPVSHLCGQVLAGSFWDTYQLLLSTEPSTALDTISSLALASVLVHSGAAIDPGITVDLLTLDDDDGFILNGTPHYGEIAAGFGGHGLDAPELILMQLVFTEGAPSFVSPTGATTVQIEILDAAAEHMPGTAQLLFNDGGGEVTIPMTALGEGIYEATFPAGAECAGGVTFGFTAETTTGQTQTWPEQEGMLPGPGGGGGSDPQRYAAIGADDAVTRFIDDFETDTGWTVGGTPADGAWERGVPAGDGTRGDPTADADGSGQCYLTDNVIGNSDVDGPPTILLSPTLDASVPDAAIAYWRWFSNDVGANPYTESLVVEISDDDGATWHALETVGPDPPGTSGGWIERIVVVESIDGVSATSTMRLRFSTEDPDPGAIVEAAIDGVRVLELVCEPLVSCVGDCAEPFDDQVDDTDLLALLAAWGQPSPCDSDGSAAVGTADLLALLAAWGVCPP